MDWTDVERLRNPGFAIARRGYDQREVDRFLEQLVDWLETDAAGEVTEVALKRRLELVGKSTANILLTTQQEAEQLQRQTEEQCGELRAQAEQAAKAVTQAADEYASKTRAEADEEARQTGAAAMAEARRKVEEGETRRTTIETIVGELELRRAETLNDLERLSGELTATIERHRAAGRPARPADGKTGRQTTGSEAPAKEAPAKVG